MEDNKSTFARSKNNAKSTINNIGIAYEVEYIIYYNFVAYNLVINKN